MLLAAVALSTVVAAPKVKVTVKLRPQAALAPATIRLTATVDDAGQTLQCPGFEVEWGDGCKSASQGDCDPYAPADERPKKWTLIPPPHKFYIGGTYTVTVKVKEGEKTMESGSSFLMIAGPEPLGGRLNPREASR